MKLLAKFEITGKFQYDIDLFEKYVKLYSKIQKIDEGIGKTYFRTFYDNIKKMSTACISYYHWDNLDDLHDQYLELVQKCIDPYLKEFVDENEPIFPQYVSNWVNNEIIRYVSNNIISLDDISTAVQYYKKFGIFNKHFIRYFIENIIVNPRGVNSISFDKQLNETENIIMEVVTEYAKCKPDLFKLSLDTCSSSESKFTEIMDNIHDELDINVCELLRFVIINKLQYSTIEELCAKQVLYNAQNEKLISIYIGNMISKHTGEIPFMSYVKGTLYAQTCTDNILDNYYLIYI